ncbi:hypothetical protein EDD11_007549 [Mortierella claussenii]|nr:hypothetical protein EDD11_007549 [Mortierella claussenii]
MTDVEALKTRLNICVQQLECDSLINTAKRKEALRDEIRMIELRLAQALGIQDDHDDDGNVDSEESPIKREGDTTAPESTHLPPISSPGRARSPSLSKDTPAVKKEDTEKDTLFTSVHLTDNGKSTSSSTKPFIFENEAESIRSALVDAGEDDMDLEALLREQEQMEQRLADLKRRRDEEDEAFARSIQEQEFETFQHEGPPSQSAASTSSTEDSKSTMQSRLDRARQERMDAEMAKIFAESEGGSFNLAISPPKKLTQSTLDSSLISPPPRSVFSIFEKRPKLDSTTTPLSLGKPGGTFATSSSSITSSSGASGLESSSAHKATLDKHATTILAAAADLRKRQQETVADREAIIDLTKPLTHQVHDISSSDDENSKQPKETCWHSEPGSSTNWMNPTLNAMSGVYSGTTNAWRLLDKSYWDADEEEEYDEDDYGENYTTYEQWMYNQTYSWSRPERDYNRNLSTAQAEAELRALLTNVEAAEAEIPPQDRTGTPEGMASHIALLEHQKIGLTWLQKMEDGTNRGGILGDDMGLGKTVQTMALIVSRPSDPIDDPVIWDDRKVYHEPPPANKLVKTKATLVITPVALMYQWAEEIRTKTQPGLLKVYVYHGSSKLADPELLRRYDVIITTIGTVALEAGNKEPNPLRCKPIGTLFKCHFHRIVIDEAHIIKNKHTKSSQACSRMAATYRWCLTGTPIQNSIDELYSLIRFLDIKPYCDWDEFRDKISSPMKRAKQYGRAMHRVQALLKAICLRRTKTCMVDGKPILNLPDRNVDRVATPFSDEERSFYNALETRTRERFNAYVKAGTVMKNYSNILVLLLRLRQACCHPHLINDFDKAGDADNSQDARAHTDRLLDGLLEDIRRRLIERGLDAVECPICMDVGEESVILSGCGHIYCRACITAHLSRHEEEERKCPECRRLSPLDNLISVADFNARYNSTAAAAAPEDLKGKGKAVDSGEESDRLATVLVPEELDTWISSSKIDRMIEVVRAVQAKGEKVIVFSQFTSLLTLIEKPLRNESIKYLRYDGAMKPEARNEAVLRMTNDPSIPLMLISLKCGSLGLNLTVANHVVVMDPWWNPALENQAIDRVHRIGQTKNVFVHRLCIPDTVEDRIIALQAKKQALADGALGEGQVPKLAKLGLQELMYLFRGDV